MAYCMCVCLCVEAPVSSLSLPKATTLTLLQVHFLDNIYTIFKNIFLFC